MNWVQWAPWKRYKDAVEADGDLPEGVPVEERMGAQDKGIIMIETRTKKTEEILHQRERC